MFKIYLQARFLAFIPMQYGYIFNGWDELGFQYHYVQIGRSFIFKIE